MIHAQPVQTPATPFWLALYVTSLLCLFATHLDLYLESTGGLRGINPIHLFAAACGPYALWLLAGPGADRALGRALAALHGAAAPILFLVLWLAGHILLLGGAVLGDGNVDFTQYFPLYQLGVLLFGLVLAAAPGFPAALRPAGVAAILLLAGTVLYDAFLPGSFSVAEGRAAGVAMNANVAAFDLLLLLAMTIRYREARPADAALIGLAFVALIFTFSRGGLLLGLILLAVHAGSLLAAGAGRALVRLAVPVLGLGLAGMALAWLLGSAAIVHLPDAVERLTWFRSQGLAEVGEESRVHLLFHYLGLIGEAPVLGHGTGSALAAEALAPWKEGPHNMYLRVWLDHGLWGLASYVGFLASALALFISRGYWPGIALLAITIANGVFSHNIIDDKSLLLLLGAALTLAVVPSGQDREGRW